MKPRIQGTIEKTKGVVRQGKHEGLLVFLFFFLNYWAESKCVHEDR